MPKKPRWSRRQGGLSLLCLTAAWALGLLANCARGSPPTASDGCDPTQSYSPELISRAPLTVGGKEVFEGRRVILDGDSYPRLPGRLVGEPKVRTMDVGREVSFEIDRYDDVLVRIIDPRGEVIRVLGCGVLGINAPEPFQKDSLVQRIAWDGKDSAGAAAPAGSRVQVSVGLAPQFEGFINHRPDQLLKGITWIECDPQGRVYVQLSTSRKWDPIILRFDREGAYVDMVYPSDPAQLKAAGRTAADVWPFTLKYDGQVVAHRPRAWPAYAPYRSSAWIPLPMRIASDGSVFFAETSTGWPCFAGYEKLFRVFETQADRFFLLTDTPLTFPIGPFAIDGQGCGYLVTTVSPDCSTWYPATAKDRKAADLNDQKAPGTVRKVDLRTGQLKADFEFNGPEKLAEKSAYLGTTQQVKGYGNGTVWVPNTQRKPKPQADDANHFLDVVDIAIESTGRIVVADGWPRRLKVYEAHGRFLGEVAKLAIAGKEREFADLRGIAFCDGGFFILGKLEAETRSILAKCSGDLLKPNVVWTVDLDPLANRLAIDRSRDLPVAWVAMGHGEATISRIADAGQKPGEVRSIGGIAPKTLVYPWNFAANADGSLYVHDRERDVLVKTDGAATWKETKLLGAPMSMMVDARGRRLFVSNQLGEDGAYSRAFLDESGFQAFNADSLERLPFRLQSVFGDDELKTKHKAIRAGQYFPWAKSYGGQFVGIDAQGNIYVRDADRGAGFHKAEPTAQTPLLGTIRKYGPDGQIVQEGICRFVNSGGSVAMDSRGSFYGVDLAATRWGGLVHDFGGNLYQRTWTPDHDPKRDGKTVKIQSEASYLVKFGPAGGSRNTDAELWAHRGVPALGAGGCMCEWPDTLLAIDGADRLCAANPDIHVVKLLDTSGNMIARIGRWGNAQTVPSVGGDARDLGFSYIYCVAASGDCCYIGDKHLRRIAKVRMVYRQTVLVGI